MRLSELLGRDVVDVNGIPIGGVGDVILVQDGPAQTPLSASFRVAGLIVIEHDHTRLLGYERELRPAIFRFAVRKMAGHVHNVPWSHIHDISSHAITLRVPQAELTSHERSHRT